METTKQTEALIGDKDKQNMGAAAPANVQQARS